MLQLWNRIKDWLLFFALVVICVVLMLTRNAPLTQGLRAVALETTGWVEARFAWAGRYLRALDENEQLRESNVRLASEVARSRGAVEENDRLRDLLAFRDTVQVPVESARIIYKDLTGTHNHFVIDAGRRDSIRVGMPVLDDRGILGRVLDVSEDYSRVLPYVHGDFQVPAEIVRLQTEGVARWDDRPGMLMLQYVSRTVPVLRGDRVVTSSISGFFPPGLPIGHVDSVATQPGRNELLIYVAPATPLERADYVFVMLYEPDEEALGGGFAEADGP